MIQVETRDIGDVRQQILELIEAGPRREELRERTRFVDDDLHDATPEIISDRWEKFTRVVIGADIEGYLADAERAAIQALLRGDINGL